MTNQDFFSRCPNADLIISKAHSDFLSSQLSSDTLIFLETTVSSLGCYQNSIFEIVYKKALEDVFNTLFTHPEQFYSALQVVEDSAQRCTRLSYLSLPMAKKIRIWMSRELGESVT